MPGINQNGPNFLALLSVADWAALDMDNFLDADMCDRLISRRARIIVSV